ncbi:predicted protein [Naegleria gruberi]|uniref:Predicted protein n=1 Tax=Naegleria gruberi TaxID=5762 RepID=D2VGW6_NAEGR|nr:uncharacterized protein NAEGRDRAFT_68121 [Naegleria gruberi]EFC44038.1 predicted protein [Naegleria gruberi]|eukprot:XP_002676782.1 predicted protein [Naegleria gruberi strain NEG-M]
MSQRYEITESSKSLDETIKEIISDAKNPLSCTITLSDECYNQNLTIIECSNIKQLQILKERNSTNNTNNNNNNTANSNNNNTTSTSTAHNNTSTSTTTDYSNIIKSDILLSNENIIEITNNTNDYTNIEFKNLTFKTKEGTNTILFNNINIKLIKCQFYGIQLQFKGKCNIEIDECDFKYSQLNGIEITDESKANIKNSIFNSNDKNGIRLIKNSKLIIDKSTLNNNLGNGIVTQDESNLNITNSILKFNQTYGILTYHKSYININRNIISNNKQSGLYLTNTDNKSIIKDNQIIKNEEHGITIGGISNLGEMEILNNEINNNYYYGIHVIDGVGIPIKIEGNKIIGNQSGPLKDDTLNGDLNFKNVQEFIQFINKNSQVLTLNNNDLKFNNSNCLLN